MEVSKVPPADVPTARAGTATAAEQGSSSAANSSAANIAPLTELADIRPLDVLAALQILLAEVRAGLDLLLEGPTAQSPVVQSPVQAAHELVEMFLQQLPEDASDAPAWIAALVQVETAVRSSIESGITVVAGWRDIPPVVVDAVQETRALFFSALSDEPQNPLWLRPEWVGLGPRLNFFRRRRRNARRRLTDPDYPLLSLDESEEFR